MEHRETVQIQIRRHTTRHQIRVPTVCTQNILLKIVSEYDQEIPQSHTADNPTAPREEPRAAQPSRDTRKTNQAKQPALSSSSPSR